MKENNNKALKNSEEEKIISTLFDERDNYQQSNTEQRDTVNQIYSAYVGKVIETTPKDQSKSQENTQKLRTEIAYIVPSIFSGNPELEVEGVGPEDKEIAKIYEKIVNYRLNTIPQAYEKIEAWVKQSAGVGTSIMQICWKFITKQNEDGTETPTVDEPYFEVPNMLDCFYNPIIPDIEGQKSMIFRSILGTYDVRNNEMYDYTDITGKLNREKLVEPATREINDYDSSKQLATDGIESERTADGTIEVFERITPEKYQTVAVSGEGKLVLREKPNNYRSIKAVKLTHEPNMIPNRFDGFGVGQNCIALDKLYNKMMNRMVDSVALTNNPFFLFRKGVNINKKQFVVRPGGGVEVDTDGPLQEAIQAIQFPDIKQGAISLLDNIDDQHKRASGANDLIQGSASNDTLGQDEIASTYSSNRFELINRRFKQALADVGRCLIEMELENLQSPDAEILRIFPEELRPQIYEVLISQKENVRWDIKVKGNTTIAKNKDVQIRQAIEMFDLFGPVLPIKNQMAWARKLLELRGIDDIDKLVPTEEEMQQQLQGPMEGAEGGTHMMPGGTMMADNQMPQGVPQQY